MLPFILEMAFRPPSEGWDSCLKGRRIVLIEADVITKWQLEKALRRAGLEIAATAENGSQGMATIEEHRPDLALLDSRQPVLDSLEVARRILERRQVCLILLADQAGADVREKARQVGVGAVLIKPLTAHTLVYAMEQAYTDFQEAQR